MDRNSTANSLVLSTVRLSPLAPIACAPSGLPSAVVGCVGRKRALLRGTGNSCCSVSPCNSSGGVGPCVVHSHNAAGESNFIFDNSACLSFAPVGRLIVASHLKCHCACDGSCNCAVPGVAYSSLCRSCMSMGTADSGAAC